MKHFEWESLGTVRPLPSSDYRPIPHLDVYDDENLDERDFDAMSPGARAAAERALRKRDRQEALASGRMRPGLLYEESEDDELQPPLARRRRTAERAAEEGMEFEEVCVCVSLIPRPLPPEERPGTHCSRIHIISPVFRGFIKYDILTVHY